MSFQEIQSALFTVLSGLPQSGLRPTILRHLVEILLVTYRAPHIYDLGVILRVVLVILMAKMVIAGDFYEKRCCKCAAQWDH